MIRCLPRIRFILSSALISAAALAAFAGCEAAEKVPAAIACNTACEGAEACGETDCYDRCMATSSDLEIFATCTACITGAGDDCTLRSACLSTCDGRALENPECAALCAGMMSDCPAVTNCMDTCVALDETSRNLCTTCLSLRDDECAAWNDCEDCHGGVVPAGGDGTTDGQTDETP